MPPHLVTPAPFRARLHSVVALLALGLGCGSQSDQPSASSAGAGGAAGENSSGSGGAAMGGTSAGTNSAGGSPSAGASTGGTISGGANAGGNASGGAAGASGGTSSAGSGNGGSAGGAGGAGGAGAAGCGAPAGGPTPTTSTHLDIGVHDPALIWSGARWVLFATGGKLGIRSSSNLQQWSNVGDVFGTQPAWIKTALGTAPADLWAPDVSYFGCQFHVYYAGSSFGSNNSVIGLATSPTLDPSNTAYAWTDRGQVIRSSTSNDYNAIDPNVAFDDTGAPWLSFGSFWSGIKLRKLDAASGKPSSSDPTLYAIAGRNGGAIEAPSIISRNGFYYLFVSYDDCCKGVSSTYRTLVGRASKITGPYTNKAGALMTAGAAEQLLASSGRYIGPGGGTAFKNGTGYLYAFHYYDGNANGAPKLQVRPIDWSNDWPTLGEPLFP